MKNETIRKKIEEQILLSYESLYRLAYSYVHNEHDAMDIVQESVYKAIRNSGSIREESYVKTWLWKIVMNTSLDFIRKKSNEICTEQIERGSWEDSYESMEKIEALEVLTEKEKAIVMLRFFEDKKIGEIAEIISENISTVKSILYRSLKKLKIELEKGELV